MVAKGKPTLPAQDSPLKTRDILRATGITHQILYRYVTLGLVQEEGEGSRTGQRCFSPKTITAIRLIHRLNSSGYTLRDIKEIFFKERRLQAALKPMDRKGPETAAPRRKSRARSGKPR